MTKLLTIVIGSLATLQLMAGSSCCPVKNTQAVETIKDKPVLTMASTAASVSVNADEKAASLKDCADKKDCEGKECSDDKQCDTNLKKLGAAWQAMKSDKEGSVTTPALKQIMEHGNNVVILDARTSKYDDGKRIPNAKIVGPAPTAEEIAAIVPSKDSYVVTYCGGIQCPLGKKLATKLKELGYTHVVEYPEGIAGWIASGNDVTTLASN